MIYIISTVLLIISCFLISPGFAFADFSSRTDYCNDNSISTFKINSEIKGFSSKGSSFKSSKSSSKAIKKTSDDDENDANGEDGFPWWDILLIIIIVILSIAAVVWFKFLKK